ncbi:unnamed protein product, partial [Polarella glacialis]
VEPSLGMATIWCKGAQDAMKFAALMQKSYFMGRKITASLCRKEKPAVESLPKVPKTGLSMKLPELSMKTPEEFAAATPGLIAPELAAAIRAQAAAADAAERAANAPAVEEEAPVMMGPTFLLREGSKVFLKGLQSKPENNGRKAIVVSFVDDIMKYQVRLDDGRFVKVKPENLEAVHDAPPKSVPAVLKEDSESDDEADGEEGASMMAAAMAKEMAEGNVAHGPPKSDPNVDGFTATVCIDPSWLPKKEGEAEEEPVRERSRSRETRRKDHIAAVQARIAAEKGPRPSWVVSGPAPGTAAAGGGSEVKKEPAESREELLKMSVGNLKALLVKFGKSARGCLEKKDFVDRLKPA